MTSQQNLLHPTLLILLPQDLRLQNGSRNYLKNKVDQEVGNVKDKDKNKFFDEWYKQNQKKIEPDFSGTSDESKMSVVQLKSKVANWVEKAKFSLSKAKARKVLLLLK